jgi:hypothetical protein
MTMNENDLSKFAQGVVDGVLLDSSIVLKLNEFRRLYEIVLEKTRRRVPYILAIHLGDQVHLILPEYSRQEIVIEPEKRKKIRREDFSFLSLVDCRGATSPSRNFLLFLIGEIKINKIRLGLIFLISLALLIFVAPSVNNLDLANTLLIQASTVFLSIYLIFTVSQSERLSSDRKLFEKGILYRYYSDDRNITIFAILTIGLTFANTLLVHLPWISNGLDGFSLISFSRWVISITTSIIFTMLFHTFFVVSDYYLERTRDIAEREHIGNIFHEEFIRKNRRER